MSCGSDSLIKVWDINLVKNDKIDDNNNIDINNYLNNNPNSNKEKKDINTLSSSMSMSYGKAIALASFF